MLRLAEGIQIGEDTVAFDLTGIFDTHMVGVGIHGHNLFLYYIGRVAQIDAVAQGFTHFCFAINAGQAHAGIVGGQHNLGHGYGGAIYRIKFMHDFATLLQHGLLILAYGHSGCLKGCDIGSLADGVAEEAYGDAGFKIAQLDFVFNGRVALYACNCN